MLLSLLALASGATLAAAEVFNLADLNWTLHNQKGDISVPAHVPSHVHLDLKDANVITEPLLGANDYTQRWIVYEEWTYQADISSFIEQHSQGGKSDKTLLVFYGIDTVATITLAGHPVAWVNNQFQEYVYDVTDLLEDPAGNDTTLTVAFQSPFLYGQNVSRIREVEPEIAPAFIWPDVRHLVRKASSDFGWDWGPGFVPVGIFKPAYLVTLSDETGHDASESDPASHPLFVSQSGGLFIEETSLEVSKVGQTPNVRPDQTADWKVNVTLAVRSTRGDDNPSLTVSVPELNINSGLLTLPPIPADTSAPTFVTASFSIPEGIPERWYPRSHGTPKLYNFSITLSVGGLPPASFTTRSGFRTAYLAQVPYTQEEVGEHGITPGDKWHFEINGKPIYAKGSNLIPFDAFYPHTTSEKVRWIMESALASGQNMVRVWGGAMYQPSDAVTGGYDFYSLCDELGILVWSELAFSDATYPVNDFFLETYEREVRQNVRRVKQHPSNVQWAGGNEIEPYLIIFNHTPGMWVPPGKFDNFYFLFEHFLHDIVLQEQSSVAYTACSTTKGVLSFEPYKLRMTNVEEGHIYGNDELYDYDSSRAFNYSTYPKARFVNEFGYHSMPSFYSWEEVLESPEDFSFNSTIVASRDHHPPPTGLLWPSFFAAQGQMELTLAVNRWLPTPSGPADSNHTFAQWCYSTQVFQALHLNSEIAFYRRGSGRGERNLGALMWMLNDVWQGATWSSIEYSGRWKVAHYALANIFAPVIAYPYWVPETESLEISVTSDLWAPADGAVELTWYDWSGQQLDVSQHAFSVGELNSTAVYAEEGLAYILPAGANASDVWAHLTLTAQSNGQTYTHEHSFVPVSLADANLVDPKVQLTHGGNYIFTLSAQGGVSPWTWVDHPAGTVGYFVDAASGAPLNGFYLIPGYNRTLQFVQSTGLSTVAQPAPEGFVVRTLWDNTHGLDASDWPAVAVEVSSQHPEPFYSGWF